MGEEALEYVFGAGVLGGAGSGLGGFGVLVGDDLHDVTGLPLRERRALLEQLSRPSPILALGMHTLDEAVIYRP